MSRIGKQPIILPAGVEVNINGRTVNVKGPKGEAAWVLPVEINATVEEGNVNFDTQSNSKFARAMFGTSRSLVQNMVVGVSEGYTKELELHGVGFRAQQSGMTIVLSLGYSHPIEFKIPEGLTITVKDNTQIEVTGVDKQQVGQAAAQIRSYYPAEPYKGKGVRYKGEQVRRKAGKAVA